ncbi:hypothetical protein HB780_05615 (plasmid) [Rhizobium lusitanum]|uniref:hypothetical protein n=1 Tax=Rhizobium lusitanum TaxID=293958 RepID=UPI00160D8640|nr:hypothetical protein [Rhizobium lusitanum]QND45233.1 hypothetical protein HB780_05615 [Rhizobium lusitanum]
MPLVLKLTAKKGKPVIRGSDHFWSVMMDHAVADDSFSIADIFGGSNTWKEDVKDFVRRLEKAGFIERVPLMSPIRWKVQIKQRTTPKVRRDGTIVAGASRLQAMWNTMRSPVSRSGFTAQDIVAWGSTDELKIVKGTALNYITTLASAGYLIQLAPGNRHKLAIWRLSPGMNTGPLPPMVLRTKVVFDQNRHEVVGESIAEEERV